MIFKTKPFDHQRAIFEKRSDLEGDCLFLEQGTGKTKCAIDNFAYLYLQGKIDGVLILAPNGVQRNWITDEIPAHLCDEVARQTRSMCWQSSRAGTKRHEREAEEILRHKGLAVMAMGYEAFMSAKGKVFAKQFLTGKKVFYVLDEATRIKTPGAKRTKTVLASAKYAKYRRILTGTPAANGPFDVYSQVRFAHPDFWKKNGLGDFFAFKTFFGLFEKGFNSATGQSFDSLVGYQNLEQLHKMLDRISVRVLKDDVLDLPPKLYTVRYFEPSREQMRIYNQLVGDFIAYLSDGREVAAPLAIVRLLRFQQVLCGYLPTNKLDKDGYLLSEMELVRLDENPRLRLLEEICEDTPHKAIIWARFTEDIDQIMELLGRKAVRYDGRVSDKDRAAAKIAFQSGDAQFFVANPAAAGEGLTLHSAKTVIYYNNTFKLSERLQSEDRAHRAGLKHAVQYIDIAAQDTVDEDVLQALRSKIDVASEITGDKLKEWVL